MDERIVNKVSRERYGEFAPVFQELLARAIVEYDLPIEYVDKFVSSCEKVTVGKLPKEFNEDTFFAYADIQNKKIIISKNIIKELKQNPSPELYERLIHIINHEMFHFLNDTRQEIGFNDAFNEASTEVAACRTSFGKNKNNLFNYRDNTVGYFHLSFGFNILAASMGLSEKELIQGCFKHDLPELFSKELHNMQHAQDFVNRTGDELNKIYSLLFSPDMPEENKKQILTEAYHTIYYLRKKLIKL